MVAHKHSAQLKLLHGVDANERVDTSPRPARREPTRPPGMTTVERRLWDQVVDELREMDTLTSADAHEIHNYVQTLALLSRVHDELIRATGMTVVNLESGVVRANPLIASFSSLVSRAHVLASDLGLNPHGRSVIHGRAAQDKPDTEAANVRDLYA